MLKQVPSLAAELKSGELNLTQASLAFSAIKQQEKSQFAKIASEDKIKILHSLKDKNTFQTQQILQQALPKYDPSPKSVVTPKAAAAAVQVVLNFSLEQWQTIQDFMAKNSHIVPDQKLESLLLKIANPPKQNKASKNVTPHVTPATQPESLPLRTLRRAIPKSIKEALFKKAGYRCQYLSPINHKQCSTTHFLEIDHLIPVALGGANDLHNMRVLCREHNSLAAKQSGVSQCLDR